MFIATANIADPIPPALKDRMELIPLSGYTPNEKVAIARQFLVPKQLEAQRPEGRADRDRATTRSWRSSSATRARPACATSSARSAASAARSRARSCRRRPRRRSGSTPENLQGVPRQAAVPQPAARARCRRSASRRASPGPRRAARSSMTETSLLEGQGQPDPHRLARRRDAGVGARRGLLRPQPRRDVRRRPQLPREVRHPHPRARGRDPEGRPVGRHHHGRRRSSRP